MSEDGFSENDKVGYRRPPVHSRFQKGRSGNPRGRQKGVQNFSTDLGYSLGLPVVISENGKPKRVSTQMALILRTREKALKGESRALENLINLARTHNAAATSEGGKNGQAGTAMDLSRLTDEELDTLTLILEKGYGVGPEPKS